MSDLIKHVLVTVQDDGSIQCTPDPVVVRGKNVLLVFRLVTGGYAFADENAVVVTNPDSDFPYPSWTVKPQLAAVLDIDNVINSYAYTVSVVRSATGECLDGDPTIRNEG